MDATTDRDRVLAALAEPTRRALYDYVASRPDAVGRDEAARELGIARSLAAFHLDRLVRAGLLTAEYRRLGGRSGPGAGRPSKLYRVAAREVQLSLPPRRYDLAAELFAEALEDDPDGHAERLRELARARGVAIGQEIATGSGPPDVAEGLARAGYAPEAADRTIRLGNCPFNRLTEEHRSLTCGMNEALLGGLLQGMGARSWVARLEPSEGRCCVVLQAAAAPTPAAGTGDREGG